MGGFIYESRVSLFDMFENPGKASHISLEFSLPEHISIDLSISIGQSIQHLLLHL